MLIPAYLRQPIIIPAYNQTSTDLEIQIARLSDMFWLDFNDSTFKNSAWTTKSINMTEDDDQVWTYSWTVPNSTENYQILIKDITSGFNSFGHVIWVRGGTFFTVEDTPTPTATVFDTDLPETVDDYFQLPSLVKMLSGNLRGQTRKFPLSGSYDGTTDVGKLTVGTGFTSAPAINDTGVVITE